MGTYEQGFYISHPDFSIHCCTHRLLFYVQVASELPIQNRNFLVGFRRGSHGSCLNHIIYGKLSEYQSGIVEPVKSLRTE